MNEQKSSFLCLLKINSPLGEQARLFQKSPIVIGRELNSDLVAAHSSISRKHLVIHFSEHGIQIEDQGSANGTFREQHKILANESFNIDSNEKIRLGQSVDTYQFFLIPRPLEMADLETQKKQIQVSLSEVVQGLKSFAKKEAQTELITEIESQRVQLKHKLEKEIQNTKEQKIALLQNELESERILKFSALEVEQKELEDKIKFEKENLKTEIDSTRIQLLLGIETEKKELERIRDSLQSEIEVIKSQFDNFTQEAKIAAENKIQEWLRESQKRLQEDEEKAFEKHARLQRENLEKIKADQQDAQLKSDELLSKARNEAERMRDLAQSDSQSIRKKALEQAEQISAEAKNEADLYIQKTKKDHLEKIESEKASFFAKLEQEARTSQLTIIQSYESKIAELKAEEALLNKVKPALDQIIPELEAKKSEFAEVLKKVDEAELIIKRSQLEKRNIEQSELKLKELETQYKEKTEKLIIEHDDKKRSLEKELSVLAANHQESLRLQILEEEKRIKEVRKTQASEFARMIEVKLTDTVRGYIQDQNALAHFSQDLFSVVRQVLATEDSSLKPMTIHLDDKNQHRIEKNKKYIKPASFSAAIAFIVIGFFFRAQIYDYYKAADQNSAAKQMIDQRRIQSLYNPEQNLIYRDSYMDNVLYYKYYVQIKNNPEYQQTWTLKLNDISIVRELKVTEESMIRFQAIELNLVNRLAEMKASIDAVYLSEGLEGMRKYEMEESRRILEILRSQSSYDKMRHLEKEFIQNFLNTHKAEYP